MFKTSMFSFDKFALIAHRVALQRQLSFYNHRISRYPCINIIYILTEYVLNDITHNYIGMIAQRYLTMNSMNYD